jgi:S-formylglutathione hydrolase FrmB
MRSAILLVLALAQAASSQTGRGSIDRVSFWSQALGASKRYIVYLPPSYARATGQRYPVAYYLHGGSGDETNWTTRGNVQHILDSLIAAGLPELIVVMPDGDDSYYTTWNFLGDYPGCLRQPPPRRTGETVEQYCVPWPHYDDYIARDLVAHVDSTYRTIPARRARAIAGLSMGGYGAVTLGINYPDVFVAVASHSGVLAPLLIAYDSTTGHARYASTPDELRSFYGAWDVMRLAFGRDTSGWWARDPGRRALLQATRNPPVQLPAIYIDVGTGDRYLNQSRAFRDVLVRLQLRPAYVERSGAHDWAYWRANVAHSLTFLARTLTQR